VDAKRAKEIADVVSDRLGAQVELLSDLLRRTSFFEKTKYLSLPGGQLRMGRAGLFVCGSRQQPEDPDHPFTAHERYGADFEGYARPVRRDQDAGAVRGRGSAGAPCE
jgi:hypothetical protein